ncbi:MAG: hypothetical protein U1E05_26110 [Patescibacteria group bacterium]|nr:hypothetical protein [Patescibacteria group bacterium]
MMRFLLGLLALCLVASGLGCGMCSQAYDYCPPTFVGDECGVCDPMARANSILSTPLPLATGETVVTEGEVIYETPGR